MKENFEMRRELIFERKKFVDLQSAFQDLRHNIQDGAMDNSQSDPRGTM